MPRRVHNGMDAQTKKHHQVPLAEQAGTSSSVHPTMKTAKAPAVPPAPVSADSSWSTVSVPKSILRQSAGTVPSQLPSLPPIPPTPVSSQPQSVNKPTLRRRRTSKEAQQTSTSRTSLRRRPSSPPPVPTVIRSLVPEPAPPPVGSASRLSSKQISNSSRDRPPPLTRVRRISTPYPHPNAPGSSKKVVTRTRRRMPKKGDALTTQTPTDHPKPHYRPMSSTPPVTSPRAIARRPSPVPPSSSKSDSSRSSSNNYLSLNDDQPMETQSTGLESQPSDFIALAPHMSSSKTTSSQAQPISPVAGVPQIFNRHLIPLPTLTFPSLRGLRPTALPPTTNGANTETVEDPNGEEYASDHPHDLQISSLLNPEELDRVRVWAYQVEECVKQTLEEGSTPSVEEDEIIPEDWDWEQPAKIDIASLVPGRQHLSPATASSPDSPMAMRNLRPIHDPFSPRTQPFPPSVFKAFPVPPSAFERTFPQTAYTYTTIPSPLPVQNQPNSELEDNQVNLCSERGEDEDRGQSGPQIAVVSNADGEMNNQKALTALVSPSPFSPLPSPFRYITPSVTPATRSQRLPVPSRLQPSTPPAPTPVPEQSLASPVSPRPHSPETPGRMPHTSTEREMAGLPVFNKRKSNLRKMSKSEDDSEDSGSGTRGRSPTRRSWKASSERHFKAKAPTAPTIVVQAYLQSLGPEMIRPDSTATFNMSVGSIVRPRTASMSRSRGSSPYSAHVTLREQEEDAALRMAMQSQSSVMSTDIFFNPMGHPEAPPEEVRLNSQSITPEMDAPRSQPPSVAGTVIPFSRRTPAPNRRASDSPLPPSRVQEMAAESILRRRKSHPAPRSVVSLPSTRRSSSGDHKETPDVEQEAEIPSYSPPQRERSLRRPPTPARTAPLERFHSAPQLSATTTKSSSLAFLKLITLLTQFTSDLSTGRQGVPRWKHDCAEFHEEIEQVYGAFREGVEKTKFKFRPWLRSEVSRADELALEEGVEGSKEGERNVLYLEDVWDRLYGSSSKSKQAVSASNVQEELIRSVVASWEVQVFSCLNAVRETLDDLVRSLVDTHFGCAGDGEELKRIVQSIADTELTESSDLVEGRLSDLFALEATSAFSINTRRPQVIDASLSRFKSLRQRAQLATLERNTINESPVTVQASQSCTASMSPIKKTTHMYSLSRGTGTTTLFTSSVGNNTASSSNGKHGSFSSTLATSLFPDSSGSDEDLAAFTRLRRYSLVGGESPEYEQEVKRALTTLKNLGFMDITSPEKLYARLADLESPESIDAVIEVMANVDAYLQAASTRFVDYAAMNLEHHLVNTIGEKINSAVLSALDLGSEGIKAQCVRWMS
ncbi:hypothetical protein FRB98_001170 [Tulasnella sp. 332]|nr:hypothetical protein FRB98_001170 [Tulasnella sp. 332]